MAVSLGVFARLKLRMLAGGLRGKGWRIALFVVGCVSGFWFAFAGFTVLAFSAADSGPYDRLVPTYGGVVLVLGWLFGPLLWAGVDETLDPARFALFPLPRRTLLAGLLFAALLSVPALATLIASGGLVVGAAAGGGPAAALCQLVGIALGLLECVVLSRAVTSAFASLLRARRTRDLAAVTLALIAALLGPLQLGVIAAIGAGRIDPFVTVARVLGWTPLAAPYLVGFDVADGQWGYAAARLAITAATIGLLLAWWSRSIASAMLGTASGGTVRVRARAGSGPVAQLYPRPLAGLPRTPFGALVAREARYWWRDARRRANLLTFVAIAIFLPLMTTIGLMRLMVSTSGGEVDGGPVAVSGAVLLVGSVAAVTLANQFGLDGSAYAGHVIVGVPGRTELLGRAIGFSLYVVPTLLVVAVITAAGSGQPDLAPRVFGGLLAMYGTGLAVNLVVSVLAAYALPETSNLFAIKTGAGMAKSLLAVVGMGGAVVAAAPVIVLATFVGGAWSWVPLVVGAGYSCAATALGVQAGGTLLDRRAPEVLAAVTPGR